MLGDWIKRAFHYESRRFGERLLNIQWSVLSDNISPYQYNKTSQLKSSQLNISDIWCNIYIQAKTMKHFILIGCSWTQVANSITNAQCACVYHYNIQPLLTTFQLVLVQCSSLDRSLMVAY